MPLARELAGGTPPEARPGTASPVGPRRRSRPAIRRCIPSHESSELLEKCHQIFAQARSAPRRVLSRPARAGTGRSRQPQGQGARRLPEHPFRGARAVHLHERGRRPSRRRNHAARGRPRLPRPRRARAAAPRLPQRADRVLRSRLHGHGTPRRAAPARLLLRGRRASAPSAITSRASSNSSPGWPRSMPSSTGSTPTPATPARSAPPSGSRSWTASAASRTGAASSRPARTLWHRQLHIFEIPFYYVEYGIAQLGALQLWQASRRDLPATLDHYLTGLAPRRLASAARTLPGQRPRLRLHRQNHRAAHAQREGCAGGAGGVTIWISLVGFITETV